jgi:hypothetical protein
MWTYPTISARSDSPDWPTDTIWANLEAGFHTAAIPNSPPAAYDEPEVWQSASETLVASLSALFEKPKSGTRPTELMYRAWDRLDEQPQIMTRGSRLSATSTTTRAKPLRQNSRIFGACFFVFEDSILVA